MFTTATIFFLSCLAIRLLFDLFLCLSKTVNGFMDIVDSIRKPKKNNYELIAK